jgi:hypothetical protein
MLSVQIDKQNRIAILEPQGALSQEDFESASNIIDPYIDQHGQLDGLIIHTQSFPGWDSFGALVSHLRFVKEHHKKISRLAISTNSTLGDFAKVIGSHFVNAEIKNFSFEEVDQAKKWIINQ